VLVRHDRPVPFSFSPTPLRTAVYLGEALNLSLR
jgi:hypothetical protein